MNKQQMAAMALAAQQQQEMQPMMQQPGSTMPPAPPGAPQQQTQWMPMPEAMPGCPSGLEYLTQLDQLVIKQKVELMEMFTGFETNNKYELKNSMGQTCYKAAEKSNFCERQCCGPLRSFEMFINDNTGREVIHLTRPLKCQSACCFCCLQEVDVTSPVTGETLGLIRQKCHPCLPIFEVQDASGNAIFEIKGPFCQINCCNDINFPITTNDGTEVGKITKQWTGILKEAYTDADNFGVTFPLDLDVKLKSTLLGAVFLIDFMFFEQQANNN